MRINDVAIPSEDITYNSLDFKAYFSIIAVGIIFVAGLIISIIILIKNKKKNDSKNN